MPILLGKYEQNLEFQQLDQVSQKTLTLRVVLYRNLLLLLLNLLIANVAMSKSLYTQNDLDVLVEQKEYTEYFYHVKDILPTQRTKMWKQQLVNTAQVYLKSLLEKESYGAIHREWVSNLSKWSILKSDNGFMQLYDRYKIETLKRTPKLTKQHAENFWADSTQSAKTAYDLSKTLLSRNIEVPLAILQKVSHGPVATFYCRDQDIQKVLQNYLETIFVTRQSDFTMEENRLLNLECIKQWKEKLVESLHSSSLVTQQVAYKILHTEQLLSSTQEEMFLLKYYLRAPKPGETLNYAWNLITSLGKDYKKRWALLQSLKQERFLPGELFQLDNSERRQAFMNHLLNNFPEYIDHYFRTCVNYYKGIGQYPYGNPTAECQTFMEDRNNYRFLPTALLQAYRKARKL